MKALVITPGKADSMQLRDVPEPKLSHGELLCEMLSVGVCGTDFELKSGGYGEAPSDSEYLIVGHESLGRVLEVSQGSSFRRGDLVVGFVRQPDPVPCVCCARGDWDMCRNGGYLEHGIKGIHGFACERFVVQEDRCLKLDSRHAKTGVLIEPLSVVAKAWDQTLRIANTRSVPTRRALITGAGPIGLLAALIGSQRGYEIHVMDQMTEGPKPILVRKLGGTYHQGLDALQKANIEFDLTFECTGVPELILQLFTHMSADGILCLTGVSSGGRQFATDIGKLNLNMVLQNEIIFGSVNAGRRHYADAQDVLERADPTWVEQLITRRVPLEKWTDAFVKHPGDIKVCLGSAN